MSLLNIASLALDLGKVNRATRHQDGITPESDTTHTVMLGLVAIDIATRYPDLCLDVGLVAQLVYVHDIVEARTGDVNTFGITAEAAADKASRERMALAKIVSEDLKGHDYLCRLIAVYEAQDTREARFVRYVDKIVPKLTHALNGGASFKAMCVSLGDVCNHHDTQREKLAEEYPDIAAVIEPVLMGAMFGSEAAYAKRLKVL